MNDPNSRAAVAPQEEHNLARLESALTSIRREFVFSDPAFCPLTVRSALIAALPHIDPDSWPERARLGGIYVNGRARSLEHPLSPPCRLEYFEPRFALDEAQSHFPKFQPEWILYEDEDVLVVWKPPGLPCLPNREQNRFHLRGYVEKYVGHSVHLPSRLDTSTTGVVTVSRSKRMHAPLQQAFERRKIEKYYVLCCSCDFPEQRLECRVQIGRDDAHPILRRVVSSGGRLAHTDFFRLEFLEGAPSPYVLARPRTGRTHQLRVQARYLGAPIVGDNFYGGSAAQTLQLLSYRIRFRHPFQSRVVDVLCPDALIPEWLSADRAQAARALSDAEGGKDQRTLRHP